MHALVDTSALLALIRSSDQYHAGAVAITRRFLSSGGRYVGTTLVLGELHRLVLYSRGAADARAAVANLLDDPAHEWFDVTVTLVLDALHNWLDRFRDQRFSLVDAVSFEVMRRERLTHAFAFDRHFVTAGFELLR
ncbi:MAG: PIN domain-containing protein [Gemmatimonadetes bacterium]|nr:PIN domain-containing protein [Gemmatimonadota bacterium]